MPRIIIILISLLCLAPVPVAAQRLAPVAGFPSAEPGYELGVSACFAGRIGCHLVMAGGCNFPTPGAKTYYAGIYAAPIDETVLRWRLVGMLPQPVAYGATIARGDSLLFIGGNNSERSLKEVYAIRLSDDGSRALVNRLADLPCTIDNMAAAADGDRLYIVGGNQNGRPSSSVWMGGRSSAGMEWTPLPPLPSSPRVQPVCAALGGVVYVWGGFSAHGAESEVHTGGLCLDTRSGDASMAWTTLPAPRSMADDEMTLSGGVAWVSDGSIYATGGVNKDIFLDAISGRYERISQSHYLLQPVEWYRFGGCLHQFDTQSGRWLTPVMDHPTLARAGAQAVPTPVGIYYIGGELKPVVRTPQIVLIGGSCR